MAELEGKMEQGPKRPWTSSSGSPPTRRPKAIKLEEIKEHRAGTRSDQTDSVTNGRKHGKDDSLRKLRVQAKGNGRMDNGVKVTDNRIGVINGDGEKTGGLPLPEARTTLTLRLGLDGRTIAYGSDPYRDGTSPLMSRSIGGPRGSSRPWTGT
jgi:hypothetical protein